MAKKSIWVVNGPGLADSDDTDGCSDGGASLVKIESECAALCERLDITLNFRQTDDEQQLCRWLENGDYDGLIINPAADSHTASTNDELLHQAIRVIAPLKKPLIEVHLGNIFLSGNEATKPLQVPEADIGFVVGLGANGYLLAIKAINKRINR